MNGCMPPTIGSLGVASHPALPVVKDLARNLGVAAGNRPNGKALVVVKQHQTKATIDGLNIGIVHSGFAQRVLNVDAGLVNRNAWAPKEQPGNGCNKYQCNHHAEADSRNEQVHGNCAENKKPNQKGSDLVRSRAKLFSGHFAIVAEKSWVRA